MAEIVIKENVVQIDTLKIGKGNANTSMAITSTGVVIINGGSRLEIDWEGTTVDGVAVTSSDDLSSKLEEVFKKGGSAGGNGGVESVTGDGVDDTDPSNPVLFWPPEVTWSNISGKPAFVASGTNAAAARTSLGLGSAATTASTAYATADQGALADSAIQSTDAVDVATAGKVVKYSNIGAVNTVTPEFPENAVPLSYLDVRIPMPNASGSFVLKSVDGSVSWVAE